MQGRGVGSGLGATMPVFCQLQPRFVTARCSRPFPSEPIAAPLCPSFGGNCRACWWLRPTPLPALEGFVSRGAAQRLQLPPTPLLRDFLVQIPPPNPAAELPGSNGSSRSPLPGKTPPAQPEQKKAAVLPCQGAVCALKQQRLRQVMPLANKALALPLYVRAGALPRFYPSLAVNPSQKKENLFLQGRCRHVWAVPSLPAAKRPTASGNASSRNKRFL